MLSSRVKTQSLKPTAAGKGEYERVMAISGGLKRLARTLNIVVVALVQLNREPEDGSGRKPQLSDLRGSGAQEQDADAVLLLNRPEKGNGQDREQFEVIVGKNRHGRTGVATLEYFPAPNRFIDKGTINGRQYEAFSYKP